MTCDSEPAQSPSSPEIARAICSSVAKAVLAMLMFAGSLILSSVRPDWLNAWGFIVVLVWYQALVFALLLPGSPDLIAERSGFLKGAKQGNAELASLIAVRGLLAVIITAGLGHATAGRRLCRPHSRSPGSYLSSWKNPLSCGRCFPTGSCRRSPVSGQSVGILWRPEDRTGSFATRGMPGRSSIHSPCRLPSNQPGGLLSQRSSPPATWFALCWGAGY